MFLLTAPILKYAIITDPFPLLASAESGNLNKARFTVVATNGTGGDVTLQGVIIQLPVGTAADKLTPDSSVIGPIAPANWSLSNTQTPAGFIVYVFTPAAGYGTLPKGQSLTFVFTNIEVNRTPGTFAVQITEGSDNCQEPDCPIYTEFLTKFPNGWGQVSFRAVPANIPYLGTTTLFWSGPQGATYTIEYLSNGVVISIPQQGKPPLANQGQYPGVQDPPLKLAATTIFTLNVSQRIDNQEFQAQEQVAVAVGPPPPPTPRITKYHGSVAVDGSQAQLTLSWITESADEVTITRVPGFQKKSDTIVLRSASNDPIQGSYTLEARTGQNAVTSTINITWTGAKFVNVGTLPVDCRILPNATRLFASNNSANSVSVLDPISLANVSGSPFTLQGADSMDVSPDSTRFYVASFKTNDHKLYGFNATTLGNVAGSPVGTPLANYVAVAPNGQRVYLSSGREVRVYDTATMKQVGTVQVGNGAQGIAFTPDGARAFVANYDDSNVSVVDIASLRQTSTITTGASPTAVAVTPDGKQLYVGNQTGTWLSAFDTATFQQLAGSPMTVPMAPRRLGPTRDGRYIFVLCSSASARLLMIDTATRAIVASSPTANWPSGLAISPDGIRVYVLVTAGNQMWMFLPTAVGGIG